MAQKVLVLALLLAIGIVAYDDAVRQSHFPPRPSRFFGVAIVFTVLAILAVPAPALAAAFAIAVDLAIVLRQSSASGSSQPGSVAAAPGTMSQVPVMRGSGTVI